MARRTLRPMNPNAPADAIAAVTHPDPYPFYARLRDGPALVFDPALRLWIASRADTVLAALVHPALRVRPPAEPVPRAIAGTPAGELFGRLVRMNDGPLHEAHKPVLQRALAGLNADDAQAAVQQAAQAIAVSARSLEDWCFGLPVASVAALLGFDRSQLAPLAAWTREFVACLSPLSSGAPLQQASHAAMQLLAGFEALAAPSPRPASLLAATMQQAEGNSAVQRRVLLANLVGLLSQTCEATAGLLGNSLVALGREPGLRARFDADAGPAIALAVVAEAARHDPAVQNTRRFAAEALHFSGADLQAGDAILLLLASAQRDPAFEAHAPDRFELQRSQRRLLGFGHGPHACPGQALAQQLAAYGLLALREQGRWLRPGAAPPALQGYRPSANARIPCFANA
ncbi:cytochrome P450 [Variovorax soli]|uniref:cytochrome P450 n=2 Tax=Variovorax soli TaxID=376815 RepID=UPI000B266F62|nr:cytochrome P450 [Variovorax soli]